MPRPKAHEFSKHIGALCVTRNTNGHKLGAKLGMNSMELLKMINRKTVPSKAPYGWGIIGKRDRTLAPMIPAGSIVQIDTQKRAISSRRD